MLGYRDNTGCYIQKDIFESRYINSYELKNLKKISDMKMGLWGWQKLPDKIKHYQKKGDYYRVPMGVLSGPISNHIEDRYKETIHINHGEVKEILDLDDLDLDLRQKQLGIINQLCNLKVGLGHCSTGVGKTYIIARIIELLKLKTLIICSGIELMTQMRQDIEGYFGIKCKTISGSKSKQKGSYENIVIGNIDSLIKLPKEELQEFDLVIADEVDRYMQASNRLDWINSLSPKHLYGLTGTIKLNHVDNSVFNMYFGKKIELLEKNFTPNIYKILTDFTYSEGELTDLKEFYKLKQEIYSDDSRNNLIINTIKNTLTDGKKGICFCEYIDHAKTLQNKLEEIGIKTFLLIGEVQKEERVKIKKELKEYQGECLLIGSVKIIGRGFNVPELSIGYLTTTEKFISNIEQYVGRIIRKFKDKTSCDWYDFVDTSPNILLNQSRSRTSTYKKEFPNCNIKIIN